jgi:flagellar biosynthesis protein FlhF
MFVKRYIANDMKDAMEKIRRDLGPDAIILNSRPIRRKNAFGFLQKRLIEVVVAYEPKEAARPQRTEPTIQPVLSEPAGEADRVRTATAVATATKPVDKADVEKIDRLSSKLDALQEAVKDFTVKMKVADNETLLNLTPPVAELYERLMEHDVQDRLAKKLALDAQKISEKLSIQPEMVAEQFILEKLGDPAPIRIKKFKRNVILLVGPTGVGKTTTIVKLAGLFALAQELKVALINSDTYRIAAHEQLKTYADILNVPLSIVYSPPELADALKEYEDMDVVLIDTAGKSPNDEAHREEIKSLVKYGEADEVLLVVSVSTSCKACKEIIRSYSFLEDYKVLVTKLDEVNVWGNVLNIISFAGKPLCYVTNGQNVPNDIELADTAKIAKNILG